MPTKKKVQPNETVLVKIKADKQETHKPLAHQTSSLPKRDLVVPVLVAAIVVAAFAVGYLYGKVSVYEKMGTTKGTTAAAQPSQEPQPQVSLDQIKAVFADGKHITFGDPKSKVLFVEFSDPSCPYCHIAAGDNPELNKQAGDRFVMVEDGGTYRAPVKEMRKLVNQGKAAFAWVYSPGHGNGELATQALYCAKDQNKFWEVHDLLMSNKGYDLLNNTVKNSVANAPQLVDFLKGVVNASKLQDCLEKGQYADRVQTDTALARQFGVRGTPSFFVNDKNFPGAYSFADMQSAVDAALK